MSVFGVDFGTLSSVTAITRQGGVDIVCNEVSKRDTATVVSFNGDERLIGEAGFDRAVRNAANTVPGIKRFIGMRGDDPRLEAEMRFVNCKQTVDDDNRVMFEVMYNDEMVAMYPEQILAMYVGKLRKYVAKETKTDAKDCVLSVPAWYTAEQRKLVEQSIAMAGCKSLSIVNETTAFSVDYGIFRGTTLPETEADAQHVAIVDVGYAGVTVSISKFWKGNMRVVCTEWEHDCGAREADWLLYEHFAKEIKAKYKVDPTENKKARIRLLQGCDKLKCMLSANYKAPLNIENLMDVDVALLYDRESLEAVIAPQMEKIKALCQKAIVSSGVKASDITVEMVGGGSRIPAVKAAVSDAFGKPASFTLNASESAARGCAITAAVFSPLFQVREYVVAEAPLCPLMLGYKQEGADGSVKCVPEVNKMMSILGEADRYPKTLELTFKREEAFDVYAYCDENHPRAAAVGKKHMVIGQWAVGAATVAKTNKQVKLRVKFHASGLVTIDSAWTSEMYDITVEEPAPAKEGEDKPPVDAEGNPVMVSVVHPKTRRVELTVTPTERLGHNPTTFLKCQKDEATMDAADAAIIRTKEARNELESYVYDNRGAVDCGHLTPFVTADDKTAFVALANEFENWLYEDGESAPCAEYTTRLDKLKVIGAGAVRRHRLSEDIPFAFTSFEKKVNVLKGIAYAKKNTTEHITDEELDGAAAKCDEAIAWGKGEIATYEAAPKAQDPSFAPAAFDVKYKEVDAAVKVVLNKKAPPAAPKPKEEEAKADAPAADAADAAPASDSKPPAPELD